MTPQEYLDDIEAQTGKTPEDLKRIAATMGFTQGGKLKPSVKTADIVQWLAEDFDLGRGHALAVQALLKGVKPGK